MPDDTNFVPTDDQTRDDSAQPTLPTDVHQVPDELVNMGSNTTDDRADSPESLDEVLSQTNGTDSMQTETEGVPAQAEDHDTPFSAPDSPRPESDIDDTHPVTDSATNLDPTEWHDEGVAGVTEASEPNAGNTVTGYNPEEDSRKNDTEA